MPGQGGPGRAANAAAWRRLTVSRFTSHLGLTLLENASGDPITKGGRCLWRLSAPLRYDVGAEGSGETITVPAGATTDLASIPRAVAAVFPPDGPWAKAAVVHDWLYVTKGTCFSDGHNGRTRAQPYTRAEADKILKEAMAVLGVPAWKRSVIYAAVRVGGRNAFGT